MPARPRAGISFDWHRLILPQHQLEARASRIGLALVLLLKSNFPKTFAASNDEVTPWHSPAFWVSSAVLMSVYTEIAHAGGCASFERAVLCLWRAGGRDHILILRRQMYAHLLHVGYPWVP